MESGGELILDFSAYGCSSTEAAAGKVPGRIRRRLLECKTSVTSIQDIEAKLNEANLRRQQFHEWLSNKARRRPKSPSCSSSSQSQDEDLGLRLQAKLLAAHHKRLTIIAKAQMRLAKLDELRQAAKSEVEMRFESRREELGTKVESRVQNAELNRMLLLKARRQRRAALKERTARSLLQRMTQERKYKDCVTTAIYQKRAAAERKRIGLLEAQKSRVHAKVMRVRRVAKSVYQQREVERRRMMDQLEDRLQKAKKQRAEYLRQRGHVHTVRIKMHRQGDILSRKLARCWRQFLRSRKTTFVLAKDYNALEISEEVVKSMQFEQLARRIESAGTLQTVKAVLDRFENRLIVSRTAFASHSQTGLDSIDHLLKRLASPKRKNTPSGVTRSKGTSTPSGPARNRGTRKVGSSRGFQESAKLSRYPVRVVLCAYMIVGHPAAVFNEQGEHETMLTESATNLIRELELLIKIILDGPTRNVHLDSDPAVSTRKTFRTQLECFDAAWCSYLYRFVAWKVKDARSLEDDLVRAACQMELSMMQTCKLSVAGEGTLTHDMEAVQKQVKEDQKLLREKVVHLSGDAGVERMECALSDTRSKYFEARELGSPIVSPILQISSPNFPSSSARPSPTSTLAERSISDAGGKTPKRVVRSLFKDDASTEKSSVPSSARVVVGSSAGDMSVDNEVLVNEIIHDQHHSFADSLDVSNEDQKDIIKEKIKETVEKAFWDGIAESLDGDEPAFGRVVDLVKEVRDELSEMAPQSWSQRISDAIDLDILSQVLASGTCDLSYLGRILDFALGTLQKLAAAASENEMIKTHKKLMDELGEISQGESIGIAMIKGLRFVLQETQKLKREISKARIRMLEPLVQGPAGFDYLRKAFDRSYGSPLNALNSLPVTVEWLSSVGSVVEQEWTKHRDSLSSLSTQILPLTSLRTGKSISVSSPSPSPSPSPSSFPGCSEDEVDKIVRLGLLKLTSGIVGITAETIPETLKLNLSRLRNVQAQLQKIIVTCTSILVMRQTVASERLASSSADMESLVSKCVDRVTELLARVEDVGIIDIVETMYVGIGEKSNEGQVKEVMGNMLGKSLRAGDPVFERVSRSVYEASRGIVFGGSGSQGRQLAGMALAPVGAALLTDKLIKVVEVVVLVATVSRSVHGSWYTEIMKSL